MSDEKAPYEVDIRKWAGADVVMPACKGGGGPDLAIEVKFDDGESVRLLMTDQQLNNLIVAVMNGSARL